MSRNNNNNNNSARSRKGKNKRRNNNRSRNQRLFDNYGSIGIAANDATLTQSRSVGIASESRFVNRQPRQSRGNKSHRITHTEQLAVIDGSTAFIASSYDLNPGLIATFPWLSIQAKGWDQFRFHRLRFYFKASCATTKIGIVMLATDYDARDPPPESEIAMMAYHGASSNSSWTGNACDLSSRDMFPMGPRKYIRDGLVGGTDIKTYDVGRFFLATNGQDNTDVIGRLFVEYDVELFIPSTVSIQPMATNIFLARKIAMNQNMVSGVPALVIFEHIEVNTLGLVDLAGAGTQWTLPKGNFIVRAVLNGTGTAGVPCSCIIRFMKNNISQHDACKYTQENIAIQEESGMAIMAYVTSTGSDTISFEATPTVGNSALILGLQSFSVSCC